MTNIRERLSNCFSNVFPSIRLDQIPYASAASVATWDSIRHITLLCSVSEEFGFEFAAKDYEHLVSFALIADYLETRVNHV